MDAVKYEINTNIPIVAEADVLVVGGGPGGLGAAVMAARNGVSVILAERFGQLGGMASMGQVQPFMRNHIDDKPLDAPIYLDWIRAMRKYTPRSTPPLSEAINEWSDLAIVSRDAAMLAAEDLCMEAGVRLMFHHTLFDVISENDRISMAIFHGKDGLTAIKAKIFIDATGDGDLAAKAGCDFEYGDGETGDCQPMTTFFRMDGISEERRASRDEINELYKKAKLEGRIKHNPRDVVWTGYTVAAPGNSYFNSTRIPNKNALIARELSEAEIEGRAQVRELYHFFMNEVAGYENARLHSIASTIGIRESRRILGRYYLTAEDYDAMRKFPDAIARVNYPVDIHNSKGGDCTYRPMPPDDWYEIPYGSIIAKTVDNLLLGSRCVSADHVVNSSLRIMPIVCSLGQAAGMAAALSVKKNINPPELDGGELREKLVEFGANLKN